MRSGIAPGAVALFWILSPAAGPWSLRPSARAARRASSKSIRPIATSLSSAGRTTRASEQPTAATVPNSTTLRAKFGHRKVTQMRRTSGARSRRKPANDGGHGLTDRGGPTGAGGGSAGGPVGYARPPIASRFKPGKSGNPRGRPRDSRNLKTIIQGALTAPVVLREGARKRSISKLEGIVLKQIESALKGNEKAALATLKMAAQVGLLDVPEGAAETLTLSASEQEMVNELVSQRVKRRRSAS